MGIVPQRPDDSNSALQIFVAAALLEYAGDGNDRVARNILEVGLEQFLSTPKYVLQYADFLIGLADIYNARALFERALGQTPVADSKPLWDKFLQVRYLSRHLSLCTDAMCFERQQMAATS